MKQDRERKINLIKLHAWRIYFRFEAEKIKWHYTFAGNGKQYCYYVNYYHIIFKAAMVCMRTSLCFPIFCSIAIIRL